MITKKEILALAKIHNPFCISIYIPTHRAGQETLNGQDAILLKNQLKEVRGKLKAEGMSDNEIEHFIMPVDELIHESEFWRNQSDGLVIFLSGENFDYFTVPVQFEPFNYVSNEFYIKPLVPLFQGEELFYILELKLDEVHFYECTKYSITDIYIDDLTPSRIEDRVGYDHKEKNLQFRSQKTVSGSGGMFHGHGEPEAEAKNEILRYFRAIDKGIMTMLHDTQKPPLIVSCLDFHFAIYKDANTHKNLFPKNIAGKAAEGHITLAHEEAVALLEPHFNKTREKKLLQISELLGTGKVSGLINEVLPAAFAGKVDTLLIEKGAYIFGTFNPSTNQVKIQENHSIPNVSLLNMLTVKVMEQGGLIFLMDKSEMPDPNFKINALYRY